jgi:hypothetical protein
MLITKQGGFGTYDNDNNKASEFGTYVNDNNNIQPNIIEVNYICNDPLNESKVGLAFMIILTKQGGFGIYDNINKARWVSHI